MSTEPENLVLHLLREMRAEVKDGLAEMRAEMKDGFAEVRSEMRSGFAAVASDLLLMDARIEAVKKETNERIEGLRKAVMAYHSSTIGHGVIISELDMRLRRVEEKMGLAESH